MRRLANLRLLWWAMLFVPLALARPKTDTVTLVNGNDITCEIRSLRRDVLTAQTDSLSTVAIRWQDVTRVRSEVPFEIILTDGSTRYGVLNPGPADLASLLSQMKSYHLVQ